MYNPVTVFTWQLYLLQLENYNLKRFWVMGKTKLSHPGLARKPIEWTKKLILVAAVALVLQLVLAFLIGGIFKEFTGVLVAAVICIIVFVVSLDVLNPMFVVIAVLLLKPVDAVFKRRIISLATQKRKQLSDLRVVAIAGSYGKTTMKEILVALLSQKYKTLSTPETINTPVGIARLMIDRLTKETQVMVVEMGEHYPGDIRELCNLTQPQLVVLTGVNEAHLERLGSTRTTQATMQEAIAYPGVLNLVANADSPLLVAAIKEAPESKAQVSWFSISDAQGQSVYKVIKKNFLPDAGGLEFDLQKDGVDAKSLSFRTKLLGQYIISDTIAALLVADQLGLPHLSVQEAIASLNYIPHRLQPQINDRNVLIIDDSYNGNPDGVREAIAVLARTAPRRKLYLTPGLVETGPQAQALHEEIGKELAKVADRVLLIKNSVTGYIAEGLQGANYPEENIMWFDTVQEAHGSLGNIIQPGDAILFQNDWPDNYI